MVQTDNKHIQGYLGQILSICIYFVYLVSVFTGQGELVPIIISLHWSFGEEQNSIIHSFNNLSCVMHWAECLECVSEQMRHGHWLPGACSQRGNLWKSTVHLILGTVSIHYGVLVFVHQPCNPATLQNHLVKPIWREILFCFLSLLFLPSFRLVYFLLVHFISIIILLGISLF